MSELGDPLPQARFRAWEMKGSTNAWIWGITFLLPCLLPVPIAAMVFHLLSAKSSWPTFAELFGSGDIAIIVIAVVGAMSAEMVHLTSGTMVPLKVCLLTLGILLGALAAVIYALAKLAVFSDRTSDLFLYGVVSLSFLAAVVLIQIFLLVKRG